MRIFTKFIVGSVWVRFGASSLFCLMVACGGSSTGGNNNSQYCEQDEDCPPGFLCSGNTCVEETDSTVGPDVHTEPDISLSTNILDFQSPLLGTEVILPLTITNTGNANLVIDEIMIIEAGLMQEYHASEEGVVNITIPPSGQHVLDVSMLSQDDELDLAELRISSNDPDENPVSVQLVSSYKGQPLIRGCATDDGTNLLPEPPYLPFPYDAQDCVTSGGAPLIDFGIVQFEEPQRRILALWNSADGNAPLTISSITLSNNSGNAATYDLGFFYQDDSTGDTTQVSLPVYLSAGDLTQSINPTILYVVVDFDASVDVFPTEQLEIISNDASNSQVFIDVVGVVTGCPPDTWDINQDPSDGCEYSCVFVQSLESCLTLEDDNCDGLVNEVHPGDPNPVGCTNYHRDHDNDGFGATNDYRCLCAPDGEYNTTNDEDCEDNEYFVKPGVQESCFTPYDDNCNGNTNDDGAQGCQNYFRDLDLDGYGLASDVRCLCATEGAYTTTTAGDCDDDPAQCGAACNPSRPENCASPYDENCNGVTNEQNAMNCTTFYLDFDGDTYGTTSSECWCAAHGLYSASNISDCNDNDQNINPAATEVCDNVDNNCVGGVDEGFNLQTDVLHCGSCNNACTNAHGSTSCVGGSCTPSCASGWGNCDGDPDNGCETDLNTVTLCGSCTIDANCPPGFFCNGTVCEKKWSNGHVCTGNSQCQTGFCRDGVCCDGDCVGDCRACNISGSVGACSYHSTGTDPESNCAVDTGNPCGQTGQCDGSGGCQLEASGVVCAAAQCPLGNTYFFTDTCDGVGGCQDGGTTDCSPYVCNTGGGVCRSSCTLNSHCISGYWCSGNACVPLGNTGSACTNPSQCTSNQCWDGYCCNEQCDGPCRSCGLTGNHGTCIDHASNTDPETGCGLCRICDGNGFCTDAATGDDPKLQCTQDSQGSCDQDGECDGNGGCRLWAPGTVCVSQTCSNHTVYYNRICDGTGTCLGGTSADCNGYECLGTSCRVSCTLQSHCVTSSHYCNAANQCVTKMGNGSACGAGFECISANCVDGVCCNTACGGLCQACNVSGHVGSCWNVPNNSDPAGECGPLCRVCNGAGGCKFTPVGTDPEEDCDQHPVSTCMQDGNCNGSGACSWYPTGTQCFWDTNLPGYGPETPPAEWSTCSP
ncbi:MAG: MopE-related protein [bacterium]